MASSPPPPFDAVVVGAGLAGVVAALRAARLGAGENQEVVAAAVRFDSLSRVAILAAIELDHTGMRAIDHLETAVEAGVA